MARHDAVDDQEAAMGMKETAGSLRAYFVVAGAIAVVLGLRDLAAIRSFTQLDVVVIVTHAIRIAIGACFLVAGLTLTSALRTGAGWIKKMLVVSSALLVLDGLLLLAILGLELGGRTLGGTVIGLAITAYLYTSLTRLSAEARTMPAAKVA